MNEMYFDSISLLNILLFSDKPGQGLNSQSEGTCWYILCEAEWGDLFPLLRGVSVILTEKEISKW